MELDLTNMADRQPLMEVRSDDETRYTSRDNEETSSPGWFVWMLTLSAGISGLLFGYDTGVISSTLVSVSTDLSSRHLTTLDKSLITASTSLFALLISPLCGLLATRFGRRPLLLLSDILFFLGAFLQCIASTVFVMILGRSMVGLAVGAASFITPLYIAELAPRRYRGRLVTLNVLFVTAGQVVAYAVGWAFAEWGGRGGWRWMVGLGGLPAVLQAFLLISMPESPRWLVVVGRGDEAKRVLTKVFGKGANNVVDVVLKDIESEVREEEEAKRIRVRALPSKADSGCMGDTWTELTRVPGHRRALAIACLLQGLQQLCGFNSLMYFSATLFSLLQFSSPTMTSLSVAITNMIFTVLSLLLIDRVGRRRILLLSIPIMALSLLSCAAAFHFIILPLISYSSAVNVTIPPNDHSTPILILFSIILYVASYAVGLGNVPWQQSELFPLSIRSLGSSLSTATNWGCNFIIGISFLPMLEWLSPTWTFVTYAVICVGGWSLIWKIYPETSGLSLEEVGLLLKDGWGVKREVVRRHGR